MGSRTGPGSERGFGGLGLGQSQGRGRGQGVSLHGGGGLKSWLRMGNGGKEKEEEGRDEATYLELVKNVIRMRQKAARLGLILGTNLPKT